jgi:hypothetical protein
MSDAYDVLLATLPAQARDRDERAAPWEVNAEATNECLSRRGALAHLERRNAEDALGETVYADAPVEARPVLATAHELLARGAITEDELARRMDEVRTRFNAG